MAEGYQDKTIIAVLAENGCLIGELQKYRVKERIDDFVRLAFPGGKTTTICNFNRISFNIRIQKSINKSQLEFFSK